MHVNAVKYYIGYNYKIIQGCASVISISSARGLRDIEVVYRSSVALFFKASEYVIQSTRLTSLSDHRVLV